MNSVFRKVMLRVGTTLQAPQGPVPVTRERLQHWAAEHARMTANQQVVPCHWDHGTEPEMLDTISLSDYEQKASRSAKASVGRLQSIELTPDGNAGAFTYELRDPEAIRKMSSNCVQVSPVIKASHRDGGGNNYQDVVTHFDLVNHAVDHNQSDAELVDTFGTIRMSLEGGELVTYTLSSHTTDPVQTPDKHHDPQSGIGQLLQLLQEAYNLVLPTDTTAANLMDRLLTACTLKRAESPLGLNGGDDRFGTSNPDNMVLDPEIATMSTDATAQLQNQINALKVENDRLKAQLEVQGKHISGTIRMSLEQRLDKLVQTGRATPAEKKQQLELITGPTIMMSLGSDNKIEGDSNVSFWCMSRESLPENILANVTGNTQDEGDNPLAALFGEDVETVKQPEAVTMSANPTQEPGDAIHRGSDRHKQAVEALTARV